MNGATTVAGAAAVLGSVGRKHVSFALADEHGALRAETIRTYDAGVTTGVSAALTMFQQGLKLKALPDRAAIAVAGLARGDVVSITNTRWFVSRSGLSAMIGRPPLILNDFAAEAWAICGSPLQGAESLGAELPSDFGRTGCYMVVGITSGLGVSVVNRGEKGEVTVLATEAGHGVFAAVTDELAQLAAELFPGRRPVLAENVVSAPGLLAIYALLAKRRDGLVRAQTPEDVTRSASLDVVAGAACELLAKAFWAQMGSLVMTFGAWDGVLVTGGLAHAIRSFLRRPEALATFTASAKYHRVLQTVPRAYVRVENAELIGAATALSSTSSHSADWPSS